MRKLYPVLFLLFSVSAFSQNFTILGNATQLAGCNCFQLTPDAGNQGGAVFENHSIDMHNSFDYTFQNFFGCGAADPGSAADGECFVLTTNPNGLGAQGEYLGYGDGNDQPCSIAIEFDTWQNGNEGDPPYNDISMNSGGVVTHNVAGPVAAFPNQGRLDSCDWHTVRITWDATTGTYSIYLDGNLELSITDPNFVNDYLCGNYTINWGWTAATGGGSNLQQVCIKTISSWTAGVDYETCNPTVSFTDVSTTGAGNVSSWAWTFGDGGTSNLQDPTHTYAGTGTYNVQLIITDVNGCADTFAHTVTIDPPIVLAATLTPPLCNGGANGGIDLSTSGGFGASAGFGGYQYNWNNQNWTSFWDGIPAGTYNVTVTDGVCTTTASYTLTQPTALSATISSTAATCGANNGTATVVISGGTPPYSNTWLATGGNALTATNLAPGYYIADFTDFNGCSALITYGVAVTQLPCNYTENSSATNVSCFGLANGSATFSVTGGAAPIVYAWSNGGSTPTISGLTAGIYDVTYTDGNGVSITAALTVAQPGNLSISMATLPTACAGNANGSATVSINSGGTPPFTYTWSGGQPNNPVASPLGVGPISCTVTDANGCTAAVAGNISGPTALGLTFTTSNNACSQVNDGSITANVTGGSPPYAYAWSNIGSGQTDLSLTAGTYTVTVTDSLGCTITGTQTITSSPAFVNSLVQTNINCFGGTTGTITVTSSGGTTPYTYSWSSDTIGNINPLLTGSNLTNLAAGEYLLTVTDAAGCTFYDSAFLTQPLLALTASTTEINVLCFGSSTGSATVTPSGGTPGYTYSWNSAPVQSTATASNLPAGTYDVTVTDLNSCTVSATATITQPATALSVTETQVDVQCFGQSTGSITLNTSGGTPNYTYNSNPAAVWTAGVASNLGAGNYSVTVTDANSCTFSATYTINQPVAALTLAQSQVDVLCFGQNTGSATVNASGGTGAYTYNWNTIPAQNGATATNLTAGNYTVTVTDANLCTATATYTVSQPASALSVSVTQTNILCFGDLTGAIDVVASGGTPNYTYTWNPNTVTGSNPTGLAAGGYNLTVTDQNGCTFIDVVTLTQPASALSVTTSSTNATCSGASDGTITITVGGGTAPYSYLGNNIPAGTTTIPGLPAGNYSGSVTDANGCSVAVSITITEPAPVTLTVTVVNATCFGANGTATANPIAGNPPFTYVWSAGGGTTQTVQLPAGNYTVTASDQTQCNQTGSFSITQPTAIDIQSTQSNVSCFGGNDGAITLTVTGGTGGPNYTYAWNPNVSNNNAATGLTATTYTITITDQNNCTVDTSIAITQPTQLTMNVQSNNINCFGANDGSITITASGGAGGYSYTWNPGNYSGNTNSNLPPGNYSITVTDLNNCTVASVVTLTQPSLPLTTIQSQTNLTCSYSNNGTATITASGGTAPYSYTWNPNVGTTATVTNLPSGSYDVTVTDFNTCTLASTFNITAPPALTVTGDSTNVLCNGLSTGSVTVTAQGGTPTYNYTWNPNVSTTNSATNLPAGVYVITVTDDSLCTVVQTVNVTQPPVLTVTGTVTPVSCTGLTDGAIAATATGGTPGYSFAATGTTGNNLTSASGQFSNLAPDTYTVVVTDQNSCTASTVDTVTQPPILADVTTPFSPTCNGYTDGKVIVDASGGSGPYTYSFSDGATNATGEIIGLGAGSFSVTITDSRGCSIVDSTVLTQPDSVTIDVEPSPAQVKLGNELQLSTTTNQTGNVTYLWTPDFGLSCYNCPDPSFNGIYSQTYKVIITNEGGCHAEAEFVVTIVPDYNLFLPNVFSPNGDGQNDLWQMFGNVAAIKQLQVSIFNRIGEKVFQTNDVNFKWDGSYKGNPSPEGVYSYVAEIIWLDNHTSGLMKGTVTLLR